LTGVPEERPESQRAEPFDTPTPDEIIQISKMHVGAMESSDADEVWRPAGMRHVVIRTIGRKSGNEHKVALPYWIDPDGERVVVASMAGAEKNPSWFVNLADKSANPEVLVRHQHGADWSDCAILEGDDYDATWAGLTADREWYNDYQAKCSRRIPLVRLVETRPAE
jgi:deazaflavin-dependent oxidoreductase (nitroreductase family)